jgi:hypothetical protein
MKKYYITIEESLAEKLKQIDDEDIIDALRGLAQEVDTSSDELAAYDSVPEIMADDSLSEVEKRQLKLKAERQTGIFKR